MNTTAALHPIAAALDIPNSAAILDMEPMDAWGALQGIARVHADAWSAAADHLPAAVAVAQAMDALANACEAEQRELTTPAPPEDMDYLLSSI